MSTNRTLLHLQNLPTHRSHSFVKSAIFERGLCRDPKMTQVGHFWVAKIYGFWVCAEVLPSFFRDFSRAARRTPKKHGFIFWGAPKNPNNMGGFSIRHGRTVFFLGGTPKKNPRASRKTSHIVWVFILKISVGRKNTHRARS